MIALVTGASRGIGRAVAVRLARQYQAKLVLVYRHRQAEAEETQAAVRAAGGEAELFAADVGDAEAASAAVAFCLTRFGRLDVLVNSAGVTADTLVLQMSDPEFAEVLKTNLTGTFNTCRDAARQMLTQRAGRIINLSSVSAKRPNRGQANYAASKGAVEAFTRALAVELARKGITVNAVAPGIVETEMSARIRGLAEDELKKGIPMRRFATADEIAGVVAFLAGPDAAYVTGQVIGVDGGAGI